MRIRTRILHDRGGYALLAVLLILVALGVSSAGAVLLVGHSRTVNAVSSFQYDLEAAAEAGVEEWRARINAEPSLFPVEGVVTLEDDAAVLDADGNPVPGISRTVFAGPSGDPTGQYGVYASVVAVASQPGGSFRSIRRGELAQESFARFAYFTHSEGGNIGFGGGDVIAGPVHSNDRILIYDSGVTFRDRVTTAERFDGSRYARFLGSFQENAPVIPMPTTAELDRLRGYAAQGGVAFTGSGVSGSGMAAARILFLTFDVDDDGTIDADEGFFRVYKARYDNADGARWVTADVPSSGIAYSRNCGDYHQVRHSSTRNFHSTYSHPSSGNSNGGGYSDSPNDNKQASLVKNDTRCFPGGADELWNGEFDDDDGQGGWVRSDHTWPANTPQRLRDRDDFDYLFPLSRRYNANFKGVIHFTGKVAVSGVLRGRVTLAVNDEIVIIDDLTYATGVGTRACGEDADLLGLFSGDDVVIAHNTINSPIQAVNGSAYHSHDDTTDESIQAVILALGSFTAESYSAGPTRDERCGNTNWGRGCLMLDGGVIQQTRGGVGTSAGHGYLKRYAYDECAGRNPPPYFPTTGYFLLNRVYDVDPVGFDAETFFAEITAGR